MAKLFGDLTSTENLEETKDTVGGGGFDAVPSDVYDAEILVAYAGQSNSSPARNVTLHLKCDGKEVRETIYITNRKGENFYLDKDDDKKKMPLPGFETIDDICLLITGESLLDQDTETKTVNVYNFDEKKEIPTPVECLTALHEQTIKLGILRKVSNYEKKGPSGNYEPQANEDGTPKTRTQNEIDKVFHPETGRTVNEYRQEIETAEFLEVWSKRNVGKDRNSVKPIGGGAGGAGSGKPGGGGSAGSDGAPRKKLFGK